jgi:asparagine synthase (glutamine-hydrolysing)
MCGIAGYYLPQSPPDPVTVRTMCGLIRHRGPDDEGYHVDGGCALGMRRLSIIDLGGGRQPISNEDGSVWVVFNGEIYNYQSLRQRLIALGHRFHTQSDTEVLVHLYEQEAEEGIARLRGMFAYAIWDARARRLLLARDRFGKKPLYYAILDGGIVFGSELKCLRAAGAPLELDEDALRLYFRFGYIPDPGSPFRAIRKLAPGGWITYSHDATLRQGRYWTLPEPAEADDPTFDPETARARLREVFDESVRLRMIADVPLGAFLSGGIDSSSVVASMARQSNAPVKTFSIGFREAGFNELPHARRVAEKYHTEHHEIVLEPDCVPLVSSLVRYFDEPFGDASAIPTFLVSQFAAQHVKVALTGDGGDELFAGYDAFAFIGAKKWLDRVPLALRRALGAVAGLLPYSAYGKNYLRMVSRPNPIERYFEASYTPHYLLQNLLLPPWRTPDSEPFLRAAFPDGLLPGEQDIVRQALYFESAVKLTGDMLVKVDRMSMANSLEVRSPMLDHELAAVAARIPYPWNMRQRRGKRFFLDALGDRLPPELLTLPKKGFALPLPVWFRGPLRGFLRDHLESPSFRSRGFTSPLFVSRLIAEHESGRRDNSHWLWMLLMLDLWFRHWAEPNPSAPQPIPLPATGQRV